MNHPPSRPDLYATAWHLPLIVWQGLFFDPAHAHVLKG
jgi:hypothetical protein